jgi:hypothetical protein
MKKLVIAVLWLAVQSRRPATAGPITKMLDKMAKEGRKRSATADKVERRRRREQRRPADLNSLDEVLASEVSEVHSVLRELVNHGALRDNRSILLSGASSQNSFLFVDQDGVHRGQRHFFMDWGGIPEAMQILNWEDSITDVPISRRGFGWRWKPSKELVEITREFALTKHGLETQVAAWTAQPIDFDPRRQSNAVSWKLPDGTPLTFSTER